MNNDVYREVRRQYDIKRQHKIDVAYKSKEKIYASNPVLQDLENQINMLAIKTTKIILNSDEITKQVHQENMQIELKKLQEKFDNELKKININITEIEPSFDCNKCKDTGLVKNGDVIQYCNCFLQEVINATYKQSNILKLDEENFDTFDIGYYSKQQNIEKYGIDKSPMENIQAIKNIAYKFAQNINIVSEKNLLFVGNTGLGKTFLANAIAKEAMRGGQSVIYQTAPILMDQVMDYKFNYDKTQEQKEQYNKIFDVDLLIIDDLGTETMSNNKFTELFNIINTRLLKNKKILISTNLTLNQLYSSYDERVMSRLIGNFTICKFIGEDIRLKKKRIN